MNTLVVPTDFSVAAENATAYAAQLAKKLNATVLLLHVYQLTVPLTEYPVLMVTADDLKKGADEGLQRALEEAQKLYTDVKFETESRLGDVVTEIESACEEKAAFALVIGTKDLSGFERFLFGDTTSSLIKNSSFPVIAVPKEAKADVPRNIVLATDLLNINEIPAGKIMEIVRRLNASLHVVHVEINHEQTQSPEHLMNLLKGVNASYHSIQEADVTNGIRHYVEQKNIDLVLVLPHEHNLYERIFFKGHTEGIVKSVQVPVMSIRNA